MERGIGPNWNPERGTKMKTFIINGVKIEAQTETRAMMLYAINELGWIRRNVRFYLDGRLLNVATYEVRTLEIQEVK